MDTNSISSNKVTLKISTPQGQEMALNKGEVLQAQVQDTGDDGMVTIVVKGRPIEAYTEVPVKPGQQLLLIVDDVRNGKTYLKVVTPELMGKIENTNISANLLDMGIAAREENIVLSRKLLQHNLPVNQGNLNELNKNVSSLGGMNARNLEIAAFALSRGITGQNALEALVQFLASPGDTAKLIPVIGRLLNALDVQNANSLLENNANAMNKAGTVLTAPVEQSRFNNQFNQLNQALNSLLEETGNQMTAAKNSLISPTASGSGSTLSNANPVPGNSNQASQPLNMDSQANATADKQVQTGVAGADGEEASSPKLNPSGTSGDKLSNAAGKGEAPIGQSNSGNEKVLADKPAGSRTDNSAINVKVSDSTAGTSDRELLAKNNSSAPLPNEGAKAAGGRAINQAGNTLSAEIQPAAEESPGSRNQANASVDGKVKPELGLRDTGITTGVKAEEQLTGTRSTTNTAVSVDEPRVAQTITAEDEIIQRLMGREDNSANKIASPESLLARESLKQELVKLLDTVRSLMEIDLKAAPDKIAGQLQGASNSEKDIIRALSLLVDMAKNQDMAEKIPELKEFSLSLDKLEKEITGQQLFNLGSRNAADNMSSFYYFAFPVKIDQEYSLCQLKINKDGRKSLKDVDKLSFVVSLNTSKLGEVLFHIYWQKLGNIQLQGVVQSQASCNYLNRNLGELVSRLEALGYQVKNLGVKVSSSAEEMRIRPVLQELSEGLRPLGIDVTV